LSGSIAFNNLTTTLSTVPVVNSRASYSKTYTTAATRSITATYSGDSNNLGSTSNTVNQLVKSLPATTTTVLTSGLNPSFFGQSVTFAATVTSPYGPITDGHMVNFFVGTTRVASVPTTTGLATYSTSSLAAGNRTIKANFVADSTFAASTQSLTQVVKRDPTTTSIASSLNPSLPGQAVTFTATVASSYGPIPDGELVTFFDGTATMGSAPLAGGVATYTTSSFGVGNQVIKASYAGDATFASSTKSLTQVN
jgi:hypothetical protein